jgi:excisionase family DNA binding protein
MEQLMTIADVAALTQIKVGTLRKFVLKNDIPYTKLGAGLRFRPAEIEAWIRRQTKNSLVSEQCTVNGEQCFELMSN